MSYLIEKLFPGNPHTPWSDEWLKHNRRQHVRRLREDPEYARDYAADDEPLEGDFADTAPDADALF